MELFLSINAKIRTLGILKRYARIKHYPTTGYFAVAMWQASSNMYKYEAGKELMLACGYEPFKGYPLTRKQGA